MNSNQTLITIEGRATYERILSLVSDQEPSEAIRQIKNFLLVYPDYAQAHNDLAVLFYREGNNLKALAHYEKAHKLDPNNITFRKNLADFYFVELEWPDDAIHIYLDILKDNPFDVETLNALGAISLQTGRNKQARQYFERTLQLDTVNGQARQALQQLGGQLPVSASLAQIPAPAAPYQPASAASPAAAPAQPQPPFQQPRQSPEQLYRQALDLAGSGNRSEACTMLENIVRNHPSFSLAHNDLGVLYQQEGDLDSSRRHHEEAVRLQPDNLDFMKNLADFLYVACGEAEEAMKLYVRILGSNPRDIEVLKAISHICLDTGKLDDARSFLEAILKIEPWNKDARESLTIIDRSRQEKVVLSPVSRPADEIYAEALGLAQDDRTSEACSLLKELVEKYSDHALGHNDLGVLCYRAGDIDGARKAYERAVELQPENINFRKNLADLYFTELGMTDDAIHIYLDIFKQNPRDIETLSGLGHICAEVGRPDEAKSFYRRALEIEPWNADVRCAMQKASSHLG